MTTDYRAELQLLFDAAESFTEPALGHHRPWAAALDRARALLAQPEPQSLPANYIDPEHTGQDWEVLEIFYTACQSEGGTADEIHLRGIRAVLAARAVLSHWGCPTPQPVAVSERWPEQEDCDEQGRCWWLKQRANPDHDLLMPTPMPTWHLQRQRLVGTTFFRFTHWLPANALPTPTR